jgi:hypothetical protein
MRTRLAVLVALFFAVSLHAEEKTIKLFNGKDFDGWTFFLNDKNAKLEDVWSVKDGVLHCEGKPIGYIRTKADYTSYILKLEWRSTGVPGNSGVLLRAQAPDKVWPKSIEAQLLSKNAGDIWNIDQFPMTVDPARTKGRRTQKLHETNEKPMGEWNQYEIILDGSKLTLKVNGLEQNTATDIQVVPGKICLQSEGVPIEFRNIELTPLADAKPAAATAPAATKAATAPATAGAPASATAPVSATAPASAPTTTVASLQSMAEELFKSLTPEQKPRALLPFNSPEKDSEVFPGGVRPGIPLNDLAEPQKAKAIQMLTAFTSEYGKKKIEEVSQQDNPRGLGRYYLVFFGEPGPAKTYAWRLAEHHMTIVHMEVEKGEAKSFGPILLGANPPTLWNTEEDKMIALFNALSPAEKEKCVIQGNAISSEPMKDLGLKFSELSDPAKAKAKEVLENRLSFFSPEIRSRIESILKQQGGVDALRVAFWGDATRRCADGGRWDFKLGNAASFLCDYENTRGHIHMSMKGKLASENPK